MPIDKNIAAYSNWRIVERHFKTIKKSYCFIQDGMRRMVVFGAVPLNKLRGLMESVGYRKGRT